MTTPHARRVAEAAAPIHPAHVTPSGPQHTTGVDLTTPCPCDDPTACPCRCHADAGAALRRRILAAYTEQRHADAERHSEARAGSNLIRHHWPLLRSIADDHRAGIESQPVAETSATGYERAKRVKRDNGQPPSMPGPIERAGIAACYELAAANRARRESASEQTGGPE